MRFIPCRVHFQANVQARTICKQGRQSSLEEKAERHVMVHHSLVNDGVPASLTHHEGGPLDDNDGDEEGGVTGVLQDLPLDIGLKKKKSKCNNVKALVF